MAVGSTWPRLNWMSCSLNAQKAHEFPCTGKRKPFHHSKPAVLATKTIDWRFLYQDTRIKLQSLYPKMIDLRVLVPVAGAFVASTITRGVWASPSRPWYSLYSFPRKRQATKENHPFKDGWTDLSFTHSKYILCCRLTCGNLFNRNKHPVL